MIYDRRRGLKLNARPKVVAMNTEDLQNFKKANPKNANLIQGKHDEQYHKWYSYSDIFFNKQQQQRSRNSNASQNSIVVAEVELKRLDRGERRSTMIANSLKAA